MKKFITVLLSLVIFLSCNCITAAPAAAAAVSAQPTSSAILVNGVKTSFQAYRINSSSYFKLRDLAMVLKGTDKEFALDFDSVRKAVIMTSGQAYKPDGGELTFSDKTGNYSAGASVHKVYLDGRPIAIKAYLIGNCNYFKLHDIATVINFHVGWDGPANMSTIDSKHEYNVGFYEPTIDYASQNKYKIGYITGGASTIYDTLNDSFGKWAKRLNCRYSYFAGTGDPVEYINTIETCATRGYNGLIVDPNTENYERSSEILKELGMPWMSGLSEPRGADGALLHPGITYDNTDFGAQMAAWAIDYAQKTWPSATANQIGMISIDYSVIQTVHDRTTGARGVWNKHYPDRQKHFFVADGMNSDLNADTGYKLTVQIIAANPTIKHWLICSCFDLYAGGAVRAVSEKGLDGQSVVTSCGGTDLIYDWDQGKYSCWKSCVYTSPTLYSEPMICGLYALMSGRATPETLFLGWINSDAGDTYATVIIPNVVLTKENYREYFEWVDAYTGFNESNYPYHSTRFPLRRLPPAFYYG